MHDLGLVLIAAGLASLATWHVAYASGQKDAWKAITAHLRTIQREQNR